MSQRYISVLFDRFKLDTYSGGRMKTKLKPDGTETLSVWQDENCENIGYFVSILVLKQTMNLLTVYFW